MRRVGVYARLDLNTTAPTRHRGRCRYRRQRTCDFLLRNGHKQKSGRKVVDDRASYIFIAIIVTKQQRSPTAAGLFFTTVRYLVLGWRDEVALMHRATPHVALLPAQHDE